MHFLFHGSLQNAFSFLRFMKQFRVFLCTNGGSKPPPYGYAVISVFYKAIPRFCLYKRRAEEKRRDFVYTKNRETATVSLKKVIVHQYL
jgi:hypothetical protein